MYANFKHAYVECVVAVVPSSQIKRSTFLLVYKNIITFTLLPVGCHAAAAVASHDRLIFFYATTTSKTATTTKQKNQMMIGIFYT
jgi:hypothetical protein